MNLENKPEFMEVSSWETHQTKLFGTVTQGRNPPVSSNMTGKSTPRQTDHHVIVWGEVFAKSILW